MLLNIIFNTTPSNIITIIIATIVNYKFWLLLILLIFYNRQKNENLKLRILNILLIAIFIIEFIYRTGWMHIFLEHARHGYSFFIWGQFIFKISFIAFCIIYNKKNMEVIANGD